MKRIQPPPKQFTGDTLLSAAREFIHPRRRNESRKEHNPVRNDKQKNNDSRDPLHSPRSAESVPGKPTTDRAARVNATFPISKTPNEGTSLEPLETLDISDGCVNWRPSDHRNGLDAPKRTKKLRNRD